MRRARICKEHAVPILTITAFLVLQSAWATIVPIMLNADLTYTIAEARPFLVLVLLVLTLVAFSVEECAHALRGMLVIAVVASSLLAAAQVGLWILGTVLPEWQWIIPIVLNLLSQDRQFLYVGPMPDGFFRVFWISSLWFLVAYFWVPLVFQRGPRLMLLRGLLVSGILVTYSRGLWLGIVAGVALSHVASMKKKRSAKARPLKGIGVAAAAVLLITLLISTGQLERGFNRVTSAVAKDDPSINERARQVPYLMELWYKSPVLGNGYGSYTTDYVRSRSAPFSYENMPVAFLAKLGLLGLISSALFIMFWFADTWRARRDLPEESNALLGSAAAYMVAALTNPMLVNFVGMTIVGCLLFHWSCIVARLRGISACASARVSPPRDRTTPQTSDSRS
jgi:hypothetical protein